MKKDVRDIQQEDPEPSDPYSEQARMTQALNHEGLTEAYDLDHPKSDSES